MMLSALRVDVLADAQAACGALPTAADDHLLGLCDALTDMDATLFAQVDRGSQMTSAEHDALMRRLVETDCDRVDVVYRIASIPAAGELGLRAKFGVIERLLSRRLGDPTPARDALLLSFIADVRRLYGPALTGRNRSASGPTDKDGNLLAACHQCLALLAQVAEGYARLDDFTLPPEQLEALSAELLPTWKKAHEAFTLLCGMRACSLHAAQAKADVLELALKVDDDDTHDFRVDLARSYIGDMAWLLADGNRNCALAGPAGHWWDSLTSRILRRGCSRR